MVEAGLVAAAHFAGAWLAPLQSGAIAAATEWLTANAGAVRAITIIAYAAVTGSDAAGASPASAAAVSAELRASPASQC